MHLASTKGGLISESFSHFGLQSPKTCAKNYHEHLLFWWIELRIVFGHFFFAHFLGDCSQREKLSEIKPAGENPVHQTRYFQLENYKNQVQIDKRKVHFSSLLKLQF